MSLQEHCPIFPSGLLLNFIHAFELSTSRNEQTQLSLVSPTVGMAAGQRCVLFPLTLVRNSKTMPI